MFNKSKIIMGEKRKEWIIGNMADGESGMTQGLHVKWMYVGHPTSMIVAHPKRPGASKLNILLQNINHREGNQWLETSNRHC